MKHDKQTFLKFIEILGVKVNKGTFNKLLLQHPEFPGYNSISDFLTELNIENVVLQIETVKDLIDYPKPQLVQPNKNDNSYGIITEVNSDFVKYSINNKEHTKPTTEFDKDWNKIVLLAEATENSQEFNYKHNKKQYLLKNLRFASIFIIIFLWFIFYAVNFCTNEAAYNYTFIAILFTKTIGLISSLLLLYETYLPKGNKILDKICSIGKKIKCSSVLHSKGAKLFGWLSWAELGFLYFAGGLLLTLNSIININNMPIL